MLGEHCILGGREIVQSLVLEFDIGRSIRSTKKRTLGKRQRDAVLSAMKVVVAQLQIPRLKGNTRREDRCVPAITRRSELDRMQAR
jgi:hypothetical protein